MTKTAVNSKSAKEKKSYDLYYLYVPPSNTEVVRKLVFVVAIA